MLYSSGMQPIPSKRSLYYSNMKSIVISVYIKLTSFSKIFTNSISSQVLPLNIGVVSSYVTWKHMDRFLIPLVHFKFIYPIGFIIFPPYPRRIQFDLFNFISFVLNPSRRTFIDITLQEAPVSIRNFTFCS